MHVRTCDYTVSNTRLDSNYLPIYYLNDPNWHKMRPAIFSHHFRKMQQNLRIGHATSWTHFTLLSTFHLLIIIIIHSTQLESRIVSVGYEVSKVVGQNWLESVCYKKQKKISWPVTDLQNRGPVKDLNDSKLIVHESKWFPWSSRINFIPFRIFRGPNQ